MEEKKVHVRLEHQVLGDNEEIDFMVVIELHNNQFNSNLTYRVDIPVNFNEDKKTFKHYPFVHN